MVNMKNRKDIKRILLVRVAKLGDVLFTTPLIRALKKGFPSSHISYITSPYAVPLLENNPYIDLLLVSRGNIHRLLAKEKQFDLAINLHGEGNRPAAQLVWLSGAKFRIGRDIRGLFEQFHNIKWDFSLGKESMIDGYLNVLKLLKLKDDGKKTEMFLTNKERKAASNYLKGKIRENKLVIGLHPDCDVPTKLWEDAKWAELADRLIKQYDVNILLLQGPGEAKVVNSIKKRMQERALIMPPVHLRKYAALVSQCDYFFAVDAGPMHIAQALEVPVVGLFITTSPKVWFDYKGGVPVGNMELSVDEVLGAFDSMVNSTKLNR
ncbi:MAG: glycosyltransferase family 9 protein [Candidatus Saganbacteria bacterium]|nr:glycosyltransferase family 9 protein [Candidatus Saganbacteria bacterium]